jgi:hypothetical protein
MKRNWVFIGSASAAAAALVLSIWWMQEPAVRLVTTVAQVRGLSLAQVKAGVPVRLKGTVTQVDSTQDMFYFQDGTGGIQVPWSSSEERRRPGTQGIVTGMVGTAGFAPSLVNAELSPLAGTGLPKPRELESRDLTTGAYNFGYVSLAGRVRAFTTES